uniref:glycosyltransferase family 25 protein n=1 Tax=Stappia sp. TaxID=1870903 RepID=UPI003BABB1EE
MTRLPILLINLDRAPERLARIKERLDARGLAFERVAGVDARALSRAEIERHVEGIGHWGWMTEGEVACFLSHRKCWRLIVEREMPHAVVLEDDVVPGRFAGEILERDDWIPAEADLVKLETDLKPVRLSARASGRGETFEVARLHSSHYCAAAYLVTRHTAQRLLKATERFRDAVDEMLFVERSALCRSLGIFQMLPAPFVQEHKHADPVSRFDPSGFIEGRECKDLPRRARHVEALADLAQMRRDLLHKLAELTGRRRTVVVNFQ